MERSKTIKNIFKYIDINPLVYLFMMISILTGSFMQFIIISILIIFHELGHFITAMMLNVEVDKIYFYPLGGISKFNLKYNDKFIKELLIIISGPLSQYITSIFLIMILPKYSIIINSYNVGILTFNLLPIVPLDGGKLLTLFLTKIYPFKRSIKISIKLSYATLIMLLIINSHNIKINSIIMFILILTKIKGESKNIALIYEKFLLERYLNKYKFKKSMLINNPENFYKHKSHIIRENGLYFLENEYLEKKYKKSKKNVDNANTLC